ncbi:LAMI_0A00848g1_1 [Lachancea mirantina]|uniref:LAMI_0A00848g1_1 n=1 Tax=Lachancea mirantina TaxID=1230905 RepID=A0A1G4ILX3_9SACH|nr:LAMI_0A00848g1_1 [Lachancea mirantina]
MGKAQAHIYLKPANEVLHKALRVNNAITTTSPKHSIQGAQPMLRVLLNKFPSFIGHAGSRISRRYNEDTYSINLLKLPATGAEMNCLKNKNIDNKEEVWHNELPLKKNILNLSVFDGHGGDRVSKLLASELHNRIIDTYPSKAAFFALLKQYKDNVGGEYWDRIYEKRDTYYKKFIASCNTKEEQVLFKSGKASESGPRMIFDKWGNIIDKTSLLNENERLRLFMSFLKLDFTECCGYEQEPSMSERTEAKFSSGSTASSVFITSYDEADSFDESFFVNPQGLLKLVVTQVGDAKIILCDKNGIAHSLTKVHHPTSLRESRRLGGNFQTDSFGDTRFLNNFSNTRSFGDRVGKKDGLSAEPDIYSYLIGSSMSLPHSEITKLQFGGDECFICLVTDGVSDLLTDQEIVDLITSTVNNRGLKTASPQYVADEVIKYIAAIANRDADNSTCLVLRLPNWGNWPVIDRTGRSREEKLMMSSQGGSERLNV